MDNKNKLLLQRHKQDIIKDLDVTFIFEYLYANNILSSADSDYILKTKNRESTARYLVDKFIHNFNNNTFQIFVDSLAKDYYWLWEKLSVDTNKAMLSESLEDSLRKGDVPRLPENFVRRFNVEQNVANKLNQLIRHNFLVLHGMSGSGKTAVAISVLRHNPDMINANFNGTVYWLAVGNCTTEDDIIAQQNKLYRKASSSYLNNSYMNSSLSMSSIGSNGDNQSLTCYEWTVNELTDRLKSQFSDQAIKESLLVLDEVNDKKIVEAFDIGCKILVTTRDIDVVANLRPQVVKIENRFEESESLELFALCLDTQVSRLPHQAKKLHELCKGNPFNIALIGAQLAENKEKLMYHPKHWNYYVNNLEKKEFFFMPVKNNPMKTIEMCTNSLEPDTLQLFKMLSVLPDNVEVSAKVLSKFWNKDVYLVDAIMKNLRRKSLIIGSYDKERKNYIYEVHALIMNYLRSITSKEEMKKLHTTMLTSYNYDRADTPLEIEDDGYIAYYIGYHISHTNLLGLFNKLFLDLKFLGNKVRLTGPADVIMDLQKYENHIVAHELDRELLNNIRAFLSTHGIDLYRYPHTDIVQNVLQYESKGILYTKAAQIAQDMSSRNELYFEFLHEQNVEEIKPSTIDVKEVVWSVCFLGDFVLIGTNSGVIKVFHISANKLKKELHGMGAPVKWISACPMNPPIVASLDKNGFIKMWYLDDLVREDSENAIEEESEESYNNNYASNITIKPTLEPFINCRWAENEEILVTHTTNIVTLYNPNGVLIDELDNFDKNYNIIHCVPFYIDNEKYLIVALENTGVIVEVMSLRRKKVMMTFQVADSVMNILTIAGSNKIIIHSQKEIVEHEIEIKTSSYNCNICKCKTIISADDVKDNLNFISAVVNNSGTLLFVSTDDSRVMCIDLKTKMHVFDLENRRGNVVCMAVSEVWYDFMPGSDVLLTGTGTIENCAKVWYLDSSFVSQATQKNSKARLTTTFDVSFLSTMSPNTPGTGTPNNGTESISNSPKRHQSFVTHKEIEKKVIKKTTSLDRHALKPLNLKGICNGNYGEGSIQPLLAVIDDRNNIQIIRGRKVLTEISEKSDDQITTVKITPCNQYVIYGLQSGSVKKYTLRSKEIKVIMELYTPVEYMNFVSPHLLLVASKGCCLMAYRFVDDGYWKPEMLQRGNTNLGSQEILNDIQGVKKKNGQVDKLPSSSSDTSINSRDRFFPGADIKGICQRSGVVFSHWIPEMGFITIEHNGTIKLWDHKFSVLVLHGRQTGVYINCAVMRRNTLVVSDEYNKKFQTYELKVVEKVELKTIQDYQLNNRIVSCDLTADGIVLAMGLDSGDVVLWNVLGRRQLSLLKHHKTKVQWCSFSPVPNRSMYSNACNTPKQPSSQASPCKSDEVEPPLVLVTMASEIIWWNITYIMRAQASRNVLRGGMNVVSPLMSPVERQDVTTPSNTNIEQRANFFFAGFAPDRWKTIWRGKTHKEGSKKKEILACIKLSGVNAKKLYFDDKFSCFVTVDYPGHTHIMNVMRPNDTA